MSFKDDYKKFTEEHAKPSKVEQGEFFYRYDENGAGNVSRQEMCETVAEVLGIPLDKAQSRVKSAISIYRNSQGTDEDSSLPTPDGSATVMPDDSSPEDDNTTLASEAPVEKEAEKRPYEKTLPANFVAGIPLDELVSAPKGWNFFEPPCAEAKGNIIKSIRRYGLWNPITVWEQEDGTYMILGGHTRKAAFEYLYEQTKEDKYKTIPASVYKKDTLDDYDAERILILNNIAQRNHVPENLRPRCYSKLVELEKQKSFYGSGIDVKEAVAKASGTSRTTVFNYLNLATLIPELLELHATRGLPLAKGLILCKLAEDLQKHIYENHYYERPTKQLKGLKNAGSIEEIDSILQEEMTPPSRNYTVSTPVEKPKGFSTIGIHVAGAELDRVKALLRKALETAEDISSETKQVALQMLA